MGKLKKEMVTFSESQKAESQKARSQVENFGSQNVSHKKPGHKKPGHKKPSHKKPGTVCSWPQCHSWETKTFREESWLALSLSFVKEQLIYSSVAVLTLLSPLRPSVSATLWRTKGATKPVTQKVFVSHWYHFPVVKVGHIYLPYFSDYKEHIKLYL